jgi:Zn-dependent peptidase ImmA (M78 family)
MPTHDIQVDLTPDVLRWARERARLSSESLAQKAGVKPGQVEEWERTGRVGIRQAERIARATRTPLGYLYLVTPPPDRLPLPDFRAVGDHAPEEPSLDLLDVIADAERRVEWYRDFVRRGGAPAPEFVGSLVATEDPQTAATRIRDRHQLSTQLRADATTWENALRLEIERIEGSGVLVVRNGVVGNNTHRPLDVQEFRAFDIADQLAPLIFLNAKDAKAAQLFSLMHELVHIWLGQSGVSNLQMTMPSGYGTERFTNAVAAEILIPRDELDDVWAMRRGTPNAVSLIARQFKVSALVVLRRLFDLGAIDWATFQRRYQEEVDRFVGSGTADEDGGGDFYRTQAVRASKRLATAVIQETLEGRTNWREAFQLLGVKSSGTFEEFARRMGFAL